MTKNPTLPPQPYLLPCPFCGGRAERIDIEDGENAGGSCVGCTVCQASGNIEFERKENFVANWNRRATPAGFALVPIKMTADMINTWSGGLTVTSDEIAYRSHFQDAWSRVLAACPSPQPTLPPSQFSSGWRAITNDATEADPGEHQEVLDAISSHNSGEDE